MILSMERDPFFDDFEMVPEKIRFRVYDPSNLFTNTQREVETKINTSYILLHKHIWVSQYLKKIILSMFVWFILIILYYWRNDIFEVVPRLFSRENSVFIFKNCFFWGWFHKKSLFQFQFLVYIANILPISYNMQFF